MLNTARVERWLTAARMKADRVGWRAQMEGQLTYLDTFATPKETRCTLSYHQAPYSFSFVMFAKDDGGRWHPWFTGRLIYQGSYHFPGSGEIATLRPAVFPRCGWQLYTSATETKTPPCNGGELFPNLPTVARQKAGIVLGQQPEEYAPRYARWAMWQPSSDLPETPSRNPAPVKMPAGQADFTNLSVRNIPDRPQLLLQFSEETNP